jgi:Kef-type K+ transport system membrane component KefB
MGKESEYKQEKQWMVLAFSIGAALGSLYGAFILGPELENIMEGTAIGIAIGIGAGVSLGVILVGAGPEKRNKKESKLLIAVVVATLLLVLSTAFMAYSGTA